MSSLDKWVFDATGNWPPSPPEEGRGVFFSGFPSNRVREVEPGFWEFGAYSGLGIATVVAADRVIYQFDRDHLIDGLGNGLPPENEYLGGLSGGALWSVVTPPRGPMSWRLAGVIYEWSTDYELLYSRPLDHLQPDGQFL